MTDRGASQLQWALVDGVRTPARSFVGIPPHDRPIGVCQCCGEQITWKAGTSGLVTPHVAHKPDSACPTRNRESAAHWNAKNELAAKLSVRSELAVSICMPRCGDFVDVVVAKDWAAVVVEYRSSETTRIPDIALLRADGSIMLAVEVVHSHRVSCEKAADYATANIEWVEVATYVAANWSGARTISPTATSVCATTTCPVCQERIRNLEIQKAISERPRLLATYMRTPPALRIAVDASTSDKDDDEYVAAVAFGKVTGGVAHTELVDLSDGSTSYYMALLYGVLCALRRLEAVASGVPATIIVGGGRSFYLNKWFGFERDDACARLKTEIRIRVIRGRHYVCDRSEEWASADHRALLRMKEAARSRVRSLCQITNEGAA